MEGAAHQDGLEAMDLPAASGERARLTDFAAVVASLLAERATLMQSPQNSAPRADLVESFIAAALSGSDDAFAQLLQHLRRSRISLAAIADVYIPEAARQMGEAWLDDRLSWLDVSLGVARLQSLLREIGAAWVADQAENAGDGAVLLLVPEGEQHTLGPMVAMGQLRRMGISVCLRLAPHHRELSALMEGRQFDGILISVATEGRLQSTIGLIRYFRSMRIKLPPIVLGGPIVKENPSLAVEAGADYACIDVATAMEAIGLKFAEQDALRRA